MEKSKKPVLLVIVLFIFLFLNQKLVATDFETWTFVGALAKTRKLNFYFHSANFFKSGSDYYLNHTQLSLDFPSKKILSFGIGYKHEYVEFPIRWRTEYRPMLHLYYNKDLGHFRFRDRNRYEFRIIDGKLINRYRNQIQFTFQKFKSIVPYVSTEFSFYLNNFEYTRQRTIIGTELHLKKATFNLFLGQQFNKDLPHDWNTKFILGTGLIFKI